MYRIQWIIFGIVIVCSVILVAITLFNDTGYFDIKKILKNYIRVFEKNKWNLYVICILLFFISAGMACIKPINYELMNTITLIISILCGAFLAFIPVVIGLDNKTGSKEKEFENVKKATIDILMFELLISLFAIFVCLIYTFVTDDAFNIVSIGFSTIIYYIVFMVMINILIVLKRISLMIKFIMKK